MVIDLKHLEVLQVDDRSLESIKSSIEKAQTAVRTAWTPDAETIIKDLDILRIEVNRAIRFTKSKAAMAYVLHIVRGDHDAKWHCRCSIGKDHFQIEMRSEEMDKLTPIAKYTEEPPSINVTFLEQLEDVKNLVSESKNQESHLVFHEDPKLAFGFKCTCPRKENHYFNVMTEAEVSEHINIDAVTRGDYDTDGR